MSQAGGDVGGRNSCAGNCSCSFSRPVKLQDPGSAFTQTEKHLVCYGLVRAPNCEVSSKNFSARSSCLCFSLIHNPLLQFYADITLLEINQPDWRWYKSGVMQW